MDRLCELCATEIAVVGLLRWDGGAAWYCRQCADTVDRTSERDRALRARASHGTVEEDDQEGA